MSINHITGGGGGGLGSESAGTMRYTCSSGSFVDFSRLPITETLWAYCSCCCRLTWPDICSPDTCHLPRKQPSRTSVSGLLQARVSYGGMCPGRGQMSSTGADDGRPYRACATPSVSTHTAFSLSRPGGGVAVPWRTASIGLHSEVTSILSCCLPVAVCQSRWATPAT